MGKRSVPEAASLGRGGRSQNNSHIEPLRGWRPYRGRRGRLCSSLGLAVDEPGDAEGIDDHAKAGGPEGFFEGEDDSTAGGEGVKDALGFGDALDLKGEGEAAGFLVTIGATSPPMRHWPAMVMLACMILSDQLTGTWLARGLPA